MRRTGGRFQRIPESRTTILAATLLLAGLSLIALIARFTGLGSALALHDQTRTTFAARPVSSDETASFSPSAEPSVALTPVPRLTVMDQQPVKPALAQKLQPEVLSNFISGPAGHLPPGSPEQINFVQGFERLKPVISVTSYAPMNYKASRGIILPAGKSWRLGSAYVTLQYLRHTLQSTLPVQIWHTGVGEIDEVTKLYFQSNFTDVTCIDATTVPYPSHHKPATPRGYALKAFALYATSFTEVILLDADNLPVMDPALLFEAPEYKLYGSMFWPDLFALPLSRVTGINAEAYQLLGLGVPWDPHALGNSSFMFAESGQFVLNRKRHADMVEWAWFINSYGDDGVYAQLMNGDKDSFLLAFALANKTGDYYQVPEYVRLCLHDVPQGPKLEHVGILHHNPQGEVVFMHRTSGGKVNPLATPGALFEPHYTTLPLHPQAAWDMFDGTAEDQNYRYPKTRIQTGALGTCKLTDAKQLLYHPNCLSSADIKADKLPLPVMTGKDLQGTLLGQAFEESKARYIELQRYMQQPDHQFLRGLPQLR